ncbi:riboflavin kinase/FMN adenylyltransferase [Mycoplasmopsis mustelae]|uniref:FAD synthase n=1 Tax=Mycoplasmopsis mustelae TaxID=171289 RepID=A0A4R7UDV5_9BACT|nr:hypothetical protein [Mycoplasmopsis mustelae]TDV22693.1 riboflavin kinase/FMN adenylyltransferase [Mycoplasmopsis mustelae]
MSDLIIYDLNNFKTQENDIFIIGSFQSFHIGHYQLYKNIENKQGRKIIVTFSDDHNYKYKHDVYMHDDARYLTLSNLKIDAIVELNFSNIKHLSGPEFLNKITQGHNVSVSVGADFRFGQNAQWTSEDIVKILPTIDVSIAEIYKIANVKISTKILREALYGGRFQFINSVSPFNYLLLGRLEKKNFSMQSNLIDFPSGLYLSILYFKDWGIQVILHKNKDGQISFKNIEQHNLYSIDRIIGDVIVEILQELRFINSDDDVSITKDDLKKAKKEFIKLAESDIINKQI